jgi:arsenical pump membrane protein
VAVGSFVLLGVGIVGAVTRPRRLPAWVVPLAAALVAIGVGTTDAAGIRTALDPLVAPLAFLLVAVPLAVLLDDIGVFEAAAELAIERRHLVGGLWLLAAASVALLNLDAAVVLLTPLFVRIARRAGIDGVALAFQPVLLACLASSLLPVSNLTNLIAAQERGLGSIDFLVHLGPPTVAAVAVGWWCYRRTFDLAPASISGSADRAGPDRSALVTGGCVVAYLVIGFGIGSSIGIAPWVIAALAVVVLMARARTVPWRTIPWTTAILAGSLAVLATAAASHLPVHEWMRGTGAGASARVLAVSAVGANVVNNLPAFIVGAHGIGPGTPATFWALLFGVNVGPTVLVTGSLAGLLWLESTRRLGLPVDAGEFARVGARIGIPALVAGGAVLAGWELVLR